MCDIRDQLRKEAKRRIVEKKVKEGVCLDLDDIISLPKEERIRLAKLVCNKEFK